MPESKQKASHPERTAPVHQPESSANAASLSVFAQTEQYAEAAEALAARLSIPFAGVAAQGTEVGLLLSEDGLSLCANGAFLQADLTAMLPRLTQRNLAAELLVRAAKVKGDRSTMTAVDATAGFGEDSLLLAAAGFHVKLFECNPYIAELLADALRRAAEHPVLSPVVARMELVKGDSIPALRAMTVPPDVVYLDPMFPGRTKSALVGKKFQLLHLLEAPCPNEEELFAAALAAHPRRIVIKRPVKGAYLAGRKPSFSLTGKAVRYDGIDPASFGGV